MRSASLAMLMLMLVNVRPAHAQPVVVTELEISRVRPKREKHETLRFLKENRDFIRARIDLLREKPAGSRAEGGGIDPRFLTYADMLAAIHAGRDSALASEDARRRRELYGSVRDLAELEDELDRMERLLTAQRGRLATLERDFTGLQRTEWMVVLSGRASSPIDAVVITMDDGRSHTAAVTQEQRDLLERGGALEIAHARLEPREQVISVRIIGRGWAADTDAFVTLSPERDRLTLLRLDLTSAVPEEGAASLEATTWTHDPVASLDQGSPGRP